MKTLTLLQPWATLVAIGAKKIETRSWSTKYRGPLLIHSSARFLRVDKELCLIERFAKVLGNTPRAFVPLFPLGQILCRCELVNCMETGEHDGWEQAIDENEWQFGDYSPGRFGWFLEKVEPFQRPMPAKGKLGLWDFPYKGAE